MSKEHLIPKDLSKMPNFKEICSKGGSAKSQSKALSSRLNGLLASKDMPSEKKYMIQLLKDKRYIDVINELISINLELSEDVSIRNKTIDQLQKFLPSQSLNLHAGLGGEADANMQRVVDFILSQRGIAPLEPDILTHRGKQTLVDDWESQIRKKLDNETEE